MAIVPDLRNRLPSVERLSDSRLRVTRVYDIFDAPLVATPAALLAQVWLAWGTADVKYTSCLLIHQKVDGQEPMSDPKAEPRTRPVTLTRVYEQLDPALETKVWNDDVQVTQDGLTTVVETYLQMSTGTAVYGVPGTTLAQAPFATLVMKSEERTDDGTIRTIKRTFISKGLIAQTDEEHNDGALLMRTLTYVNQVPPTPTGYTLISQKVENPGGLPVYTYTFALGTGQVSYDTEYRLSPDQGTTGVTVITIRYLSTPSVVSNPIATPGGYELIKVSYEDNDGHRVWNGIYANGAGTISSVVDTRIAGCLVTYSITAMNAIPSAPAATIGGSVTLVSAAKRNGTRFEDGTIIYDYRWVEANNQNQQSIVARNDGLREVTYVTLGTRVAPSGVVIKDDYRIEEGYTSYSVTAMQAKDGNSDPTMATLTLPRTVMVQHPGRAKPYNKNVGGVQFVDVFMSPPIEVEVIGAVKISYQTSSAITLDNPLWAPTGWATISAYWVGTYNFAASKITALRGYRTIGTGTPISATVSVTYGSLTTNSGTMLGNAAYGGSSGSLSVYGGPPDPTGNTYTIGNGNLEVAFTSTTGTVYYRKTQVYATFPTLDTLPV